MAAALLPLRAATVLAVCCGLPLAAQAQSDPLPVRESAPGVYVHTVQVADWLPDNGGDVANLGVIIGSRCVAVVDTGGTPALGQRWRAAIERLTRVPLCFVIHTHAHPDHVLGAGAFTGPGIQRVASARFSAALAARAPYFANVLVRDFGVPDAGLSATAPELAVQGRQTLDLGDRVIDVQAWPTAHTDNDLTVFDRRTRTLFTGDLLFIQHMPVVDGQLRGWLAVMDQLAALPAARVVPGHGPVSEDWPGALQPQRAYLTALRDETRAALKAGKTLQQAVDSVGSDAATRWQLADRFHRRNVTAAFAELEWEDD